MLEIANVFEPTKQFNKHANQIAGVYESFHVLEVLQMQGSPSH